MKKLKETAYNTAEALFEGTDAFLKPGIQNMVLNRWKSYEICMEDEEDWHDFFIEKTNEVGDMAMYIVMAQAEADNVFLTYSEETEGSTTVETEDTTQIKTSGDTVQANSGYDNNQTGSTDKNLDTPQGNISNLDDGYMTSANKSQGTNNNSNLSTASQSSDTTTEHSGGVTQWNDNSGTRKGFTGERPMLLDRYLQIMPGIAKRITDLWAECFVLFYEEGC